jgi:hypothetical protein
MVMNLSILSKGIMLLSSRVAVSFTGLAVLYGVNLLMLVKLTRARISEDLRRRCIPACFWAVTLQENKVVCTSEQKASTDIASEPEIITALLCTLDTNKQNICWAKKIVIVV